MPRSPLLPRLLLVGSLILASAALPGADPVPTPVPETAVAFAAWEPADAEAMLMLEAVFLPRDRMKAMGLARGAAVVLAPQTPGAEPRRAFAWPVPGDEDTLQLTPDLAAALGLEGNGGPAALSVAPWPAGLTPPVGPEPPGVSVAVLPGDTTRWTGLVLGAPHGDYDAHTGRIVEEVNRTTGVPSVVAWGARLTFLGRWVDGNRPTQRLPGDGFLLRVDREWTRAAEDVYRRYRAGLLEVTATADRRPGEVPIALYVDFHGHNLSVRTPDGRSVRRNVFECVARGFTRDEVRALKAAFDAAVAAELGDAAPPSQWDNLPEDNPYTVEGVSTELTYHALASRVTGTLSSDVSLRAIHIETPNRLRYNEATRTKLPGVLARFLTKLHAEIGPPSLARNNAPAPDFGAVAPPAAPWARLANGVTIATTEVTNAEFAAFANRALERGDARLVDGLLVANADGTPWAETWPGSPVALLDVKDGRLAPRAGRERHPVIEVSRPGAEAYARSVGGRLPSLREWREAAAGVVPDAPANYMHGPRAVETGPFPWTAPVGAYPASASALGCLDMAGNVYEWTADMYESDEASLEATYTPTMAYIIGGAWDTEARAISPSDPTTAPPTAMLANVGLRVARDAGVR